MSDSINYTDDVYAYYIPRNKHTQYSIDIILDTYKILIYELLEAIRDR